MMEKSIVGIIIMISFQWSEPEEIRCPGARHRVRSCQRRAADKQQSTGLLHLHLRISFRVHQKKEHAKRRALSFGGPEEIRTPDPYNANVMRSQLRYGPMDYPHIIAPEQPLVKFFLPFFQKTWYDVGQTTPKE